MKIIIVGAGEVGYQIAEALCGERREVVIIDNDAQRLKQIEESLDAQFLVGSGSSPDILTSAGVKTAEMIIAVSDQDEVNLIACLLASHYAPHATKIARLRNPAYIRYPEAFEDLGLNLFINPEQEASHKIIRLLDVPQAVDIIDFADGKVMLVGFRIEPESLIVHKKLFKLIAEDAEYSPLIAAIFRGDEVIVPKGGDQILEGDVVYFTVTPDNLSKLLRFLGKKTRNVENVMIFGGGNTGLYLAKALEQKGIDVKLIEPDKERCSYLADQLSKTMVLHGDATNTELLRQENISKMDMFISVSKEDEDNIFACLLAKSGGARYTMTLSNHTDYASLVSNLGIDASISPQLAAVSRIMRFLREGKVMAVETIRNRDTEGIEFKALPTSGAVGVALKNIKFPEGALTIAIVRGDEVIIPSGETVIMPEDRVVVFTKKKAIGKVEKLFAVKLEFF